MTRKGGFLKGIVASAATYAVKTAVDIAANPENMQKVAQLVSEQQVGSKLKQAAANMHLPAALSPSARHRHHPSVRDRQNQEPHREG